MNDIPLSSIIIDRDVRQRRELKDIDGLAESIARTGFLINPILVTRDLKLVAGERRFTACSKLGWSTIPVRYTDEVSEQELYLLELEENTKRLDLTWQEQLAATTRYHELQSEINADWSVAKTAAALSVEPNTVHKHLAVSAAIIEEPELGKLPKFSTALGVVQRKEQRKSTTALRDLKVSIAPVAEKNKPAPKETEAPLPVATRHSAILNDSFLRWAPKYEGERFNFIHCDFPYGANAGDKIGQSSAKSMGGYVDTEEVYFQLLAGFITHQDRFIEEAAHLMFWFDMGYYSVTKKAFSEAGWVVNPFPLIWHKTDNKGILPDPNRGPRRIYETALLCTRGDRFIVKPRANVFGGPTTKEHHMSEKSAAMLEHFFGMLVDDSTRMLDPTCGGANAVKVSEQMGARYSLGIEMNAEFAERAKDNLGY